MEPEVKREYVSCNLQTYPNLIRDLIKYTCIQTPISSNSLNNVERIAKQAYDYLTGEEKKQYIDIIFDGFIKMNNGRYNARFHLVARENSKLMHLLKPF